MNKKGFTLFELVAAILLLSIILTMVSYNVMGHLNKNRKKIVIESAEGYVNAINDNNFINDPDKYIGSGSVATINPKLKNQISGDLPIRGSVTVNSTTKQVSSAELYFDKFKVTYNGTRYIVETS